MSRPRGRPREFDVELALGRLTDAFWETGYSGTSLDRLSEMSGVARPSLYAAFGDKQAMYLAALGAFTTRMGALAESMLTAENAHPNGLLAYYEACLSVYAPKADQGRGCFVVCTASAESGVAVEIRRALANTVSAMDAGLRRFFQAARERGTLPPGSEPACLAKIASAVLQSAAIRARAGMPPEELRSFCQDAVSWLFGQTAAAGRRRSRPSVRRGRPPQRTAGGRRR